VWQFRSLSPQPADTEQVASFPFDITPFGEELSTQAATASRMVLTGTPRSAEILRQAHAAPVRRKVYSDCPDLRREQEAQATASHSIDGDATPKPKSLPVTGILGNPSFASVDHFSPYFVKSVGIGMVP
jgi:hypothetical protein